jgi:N-acyl-L-homoserine lactone synthetase
MIHVVTAANRRLYADALRQMHELRRAHFVEERGWTAMTVRDGGEYDAYDDDQTVYLLAIEADGAVSCSMRMRPALTGSILADVFPHLVAEDEPALARPEVWEISRYFAAPRARGRSGVRRRAEIRLASLEVAMARGAKRLVGMIDLEMLPPMLNGSGWRVRTLGLPAPYDEGIAQAIEVEVSRAAVSDMMETQDLEAPVSLELDPDTAPIRLPPHEIEAILQLEQAGADRLRLIVALVNKLVEMQDKVSEDDLLQTVAYVESLIRSGRGEARAS